MEQSPKPAVKFTVSSFAQLKQMKYLKFSVFIVLILTKAMIENELIK